MSRLAAYSLTRRWALALTLALVPGIAHAQPTTTRVSVGSGGAQANSDSSWPAISADGRWVAFESHASNLVAGDTNGTPDVFVHDRQDATVTRVSVGPAGAEANGYSYTPIVSADGRYVAFQSSASNLVVGDTNTVDDVFVHDRQSATTTRISVGPGDVQGDAHSGGPALSADGRWVAFTSMASNLVTGDTNGQFDVFVRDQQTGTITRVSVGPGGAQGNAVSFAPALSSDGRWVAFLSDATTLVTGDTNGNMDVFVHDRQVGTTTRVNVGPGSAEANADADLSLPAISGDGRWVAFSSMATNLVAGDTNGRPDVFVHDRQGGTTSRVNVGPGGIQADAEGSSPAISADGRWVAFASWATNLVAGDTNRSIDVFVHDQQTATTTRVSVGPGDIEGNYGSSSPAISGDGRWVAFSSTATNFVAGDTNVRSDVFVRDRGSLLPPMPPEGLAAAVAGPLVTLRWTIQPGDPVPTGFLLEGGLTPGEVLASIPTGSAAPTFSFAAPSGSFFVRMYALNGVFRSPASNEIRIHVNVPVTPSGPANLLGLVNGSTLALAWSNTYAGGAPTSLVLDVTGTITTSVPLGLTDTFSFAGVPAGTYTLALRAQNATGSSPSSNAVTLTFPGVCSGPPDTPASVVAYAAGRTVFVDWTTPGSGPAPTGYVLGVTGSYVGSFPTATRALSGTVGPGSYTLSVAAVNACGTSATSAPQTVVVP